jgi:hypothetical protein
MSGATDATDTAAMRPTAEKKPAPKNWPQIERPVAISFRNTPRKPTTADAEGKKRRVSRVQQKAKRTTQPRQQ